MHRLISATWPALTFADGFGLTVCAGLSRDGVDDGLEAAGVELHPAAAQPTTQAAHAMARLTRLAMLASAADKIPSLA